MVFGDDDADVVDGVDDGCHSDDDGEADGDKDVDYGHVGDDEDACYYYYGGGDDGLDAVDHEDDYVDDASQCGHTGLFHANDQWGPFRCC